jgi:N-acetylneuraminic acid mutarotase
VYNSGGKQNAGYYLSTVERFNLSDNTWQQLSPMPVKLRGAAATMVNGRIWLIGGSTNQDWDQRVWVIFILLLVY